MPRLEPIGRVEDPSELTLEPLVIPIAAYIRHTVVDVEADPDNGVEEQSHIEVEEVIQDISFRPMAPSGPALDVMRATDGNGNAPIGPVMNYLDECVTAEDRAVWVEFLHDPVLNIEQPTLLAVYRALTEFYSARPTKQRSVLHTGRTTSSRFSRVAASEAASTSDGSHLSGPST